MNGASDVKEMIKMNHQKFKRILLPSALVLSAALIALYFLATSWIVRYHNFRKIAQTYAVSGDAVTMSTLFDFEWDEVYSDRGVFSDGETLKRKYGLSFDIPRTTREDVARLLFFKDGELVEAGTYPKYYLTIPSEVDKMLPTTEVRISFGPSEKILEISLAP